MENENVLEASSKGPSNSADNIERESVLSDNVEAIIEYTTLTNAVGSTTKRSAEADSSTEILVGESSTDNLDKTSTSTEVDVFAQAGSVHSSTQILVETGSPENKEGPLKVFPSNISQSGEDAFTATKNLVQHDEGLVVEEVSNKAKPGSAVANKTDGIAASEIKDTESSKDQKTPTDTDKECEKPSSSPTVSTDEGVDVNYAEHMTYESDGSAIYEDPKTKYRYKWSSTENSWMPCDSNNAEGGTNATNPYENEHYKWCTETQKWIPKEQSQTTETEHYKWDAERKEWIPKVKFANNNSESSSDRSNVTYDIDKDGQRIYTDKDGTLFFWDTSKNAWFPKIDDDFMAHYQMNYGFIDNTSVSEEEKRRKAEEEAKLKELELQRMTEEAKAGTEAMARGDVDGAANTGSGVKRKAQEPPKWFDIDPDQNTKVYVSNLPLDITLDEFAELMGKCGMIMRDPQTQKFKLKLYAEPDGQLKGDGLCDYIKVESVGLALNILDDYNLRGNTIHVQRAKFQMRGEYNPALKPKRKKKDKEKLQKMKEKLFDWRPEKMRGERSKNEKVVIIKNLFDPSIFEKEVQLILDYQNDLREECRKCGTVRKVVVYDRHPEGVAQINMADPEEADVVIQMMQGRYFGQRQLTAEHWDGKTKYKVVESEGEVQKRLNNWDQYLKQEENERKIEESKSQTTEAVAELCTATEGASTAPEATQDVLSATSECASKTQEVTENMLATPTVDVKDEQPEKEVESGSCAEKSERNENKVPES